MLNGNIRAGAPRGSIRRDGGDGGRADIHAGGNRGSNLRGGGTHAARRIPRNNTHGSRGTRRTVRRIRISRNGTRRNSTARRSLLL